MDEISVQEKNIGGSAENGQALSQKEIQSQVDEICADPKRVLDALNALLTKNGKKPMPEERMLQGVDPAAADGARKYLQRRNECLGLMGRYQRPDDTEDFARVFTLFLKPEQNEEDIEENRKFMESLGTPQGRRDLFYRCVDILEKADKAVFLQKDKSKMLAAAGADSDMFLIAGVVKSTLAAYANREEMADVRISNPELIESLRDVSLYEGGVGIDSQARLYQDQNSVMLQNMNVDELTLLMNASELEKTPVENALLKRLSGAISFSLTAAFDRGDFNRARPEKKEAAEPVDVVGLLSEKGLLTGHVVFTDEDGSRMKQEAGVRALAEGKTVHLQQCDSFDSTKQTSYVLSVNGNTLQYVGRAADRKAEKRPDYDPKLVDAANQLEAYEADRPFFYRNAAGEELTRKAALQAFSNGEPIQAVQYDEKYPYLGKAEQICRKRSGEMEALPQGVASRQIDLTAVARTPEKQLEALENALKSLEQTHKTAYFGLLKDSKEFSNAMTSLSNTIKMLKNPKNPPSEVDVRVQFTNLKNTVSRYIEVKTEKIARRTDNDWVGQSRLDTLSSLKSLLNDNVANGLSAHMQKAAAEKQAAQKQAEASSSTKKNEGRGLG